jgi:hypothetical protein
MAAIYVDQKKDDAKAIAAYKGALDATPEKEREALLKQIPPQLLSKI